MNLLEATIVQPTQDGIIVSCEMCGLSYPDSDYKSLKDGRKLVYFNFMDQVLCHGCFCNQAIKYSDLTPKVRVTDKDMSFVLNFEDYQ
jgi:hypothetical protein